jgi:glycosyltransferase involved in cell wall biosynthesis
VSEAIDSVLEQDPPPDEVIVINDGSTDNTSEILSKYGNEITVIHQENAGSGAARNAGLKRAKGEWLTFADSDDLWFPGRLALLHQDLLNKDNYDIVIHVADLRITGENYDRGLFELQGWKLSDGSGERVSDPLARAMKGLYLISSAIRRDVAKKTKGFPPDLKIQQDGYFLCAVAAQGSAYFRNSAVAEVRRLAGDTTANVELWRKNPLSARRMAQKRIDMVAELNLTFTQRQLVCRSSSGNLFELAREESISKEGRPRRTLLKMAMTHPNPFIGWMKALPPIIFGRSGFNLVPAKRTNFIRVSKSGQ